MSVIEAARSMGVTQNLTFRVIDQVTGKVVQEHTGHNCATNSLLVGIAHYLTGDNSLGDATITKRSSSYALQAYIPRYISLGTMGLYSQEEDENGLPAGVGVLSSLSEEDNFQRYKDERPGYSADGYNGDYARNNNRPYFGLGPAFDSPVRTWDTTTNCELISSAYTRTAVSFRQILPESKSELPKTMDIVYSAMISTGALRSFREPGKDFIFITEAGLWSDKTYEESGENGLLAGYRIMPPDKTNWDMSDPANREILKHNVLRVNINQVVQIVWKIQLGSVDELVSETPEYELGDNIYY